MGLYPQPSKGSRRPFGLNLDKALTHAEFAAEAERLRAGRLPDKGGPIRTEAAVEAATRFWDGSFSGAADIDLLDAAKAWARLAMPEAVGDRKGLVSAVSSCLHAGGPTSPLEARLVRADLQRRGPAWRDFLALAVERLQAAVRREYDALGDPIPFARRVQVDRLDAQDVYDTESFGGFEDRPEGAEVNVAYLDPAPQPLSMVTVGRNWALSHQRIFGDSAGLLESLPEGVANAIRRAEGRSVAKALEAASGFTTATAAALAAGSLDDAISAFAGIQDSRGENPAIRPRYLVVPAALAGQAAAAITGVYGAVAGANLEAVTLPTLSSATAWYLAPMNGATLAGLRGQDPTGELRIMSSWERQGIDFSARLDLGGAIPRPSYVVKNAGA